MLAVLIATQLLLDFRPSGAGSDALAVQGATRVTSPFFGGAVEGGFLQGPLAVSLGLEGTVPQWIWDGCVAGACSTRLGAHIAAGPAIALSQLFTLDLRGLAGVHFYRGVFRDDGWFRPHSDDTSAALPFVGARAEVLLALRPALGIGLGAFVLRDLGTARRSVVTHDDLNGTNTPDVIFIGGTSIGASVALRFLLPAAL